MTRTYETTIERCATINGVDVDHEVDVTIEYEAVPAEPRTWEYPGVPAHVEIQRVVENETGIEIELTTRQEDWVERQIGEYEDSRDDERGYDG